MKTIIKLKVFILILLFTSCGGETTTSSNETILESSTSNQSCPHCAGLGRRTNNMTGEFTDCSSCGGDGEVTQEQYNRLSK